MLTNVFICVMIIDPGVPFCLNHHIEEAMRGQLLRRPHSIHTSHTSHIQHVHQAAHKTYTGKNSRR